MNYYQYIEQLATQHKLVAHSENEKHYFRGELEEFYMDLRNKVRFPAVVAESFELSFDNQYKQRETSFIIVVAYKESKNWTQIYSAYDLCERIGDEFLRRMIDDASNGALCANVELLSATPLLDEQHLYAGIRYTIVLSTPFVSEPDPDEWNIEN